MPCCWKLLESRAPADIRCLMATPTVESLSKILFFFTLAELNGKVRGCKRVKCKTQAS